MQALNSWKAWDSSIKLKMGILQVRVTARVVVNLFYLHIPPSALHLSLTYGAERLVVS